MADTTPVKSILRIAIDCVSLVIVCLPTLIAEYASIQPFHRGWYCDDESIKKPYKSSTLPSDWTIAAAVLIPTAVVVVVELIHYKYNPGRDLLPKFTIRRYNVNHYSWTLYRFLGLYYFGLAASMSFVHIGKMAVGRLRPHFIDVCKPDWSKVNCSWYVEGDVCTGDPVKLLDARKSFPSGHSAISFFAMVFTAMYLQRRMTWRVSRVLRHALQAVCLWMAWYTALSRISDYKHHWSDVLSGALLGTVSAVIVVLHICDRFRPPGHVINNHTKIQEV